MIRLGLGPGRVTLLLALLAFPAAAQPAPAPAPATEPEAEAASGSETEPERETEAESEAESAGYDVSAVAIRPRPLTASTAFVEAREIQALPQRSAEDALRLVPGMVLVQHGSEGKGHQFFLRGFDAIHGADLELTLEGIPINEWSNIHAQGYIDLGLIVPEAIQTVEVTKGPFTLDQGAFAMAGSADYRLGIAPASRGLRVAYQAGTTNRQRGVVSYSPRQGDGRQFLVVEALHDDGYGQNRDINRFALTSKFRLVDAGPDELWVLAAGEAAAFGLPGTLRDEDVQAGRIGFYDSYDLDQNGLSARGLLALSFEHAKGAGRVRARVYAGPRRIELVENYTGFLYDPVQGDGREQLQGGVGYGAQLAADLELSRELILVCGADVRGDAFEQEQLHVDTEERPIEPERSMRAVQNLFDARAGLRWRPLSVLHLAAGARMDVAQVALRDALADDAKSAGVLVSATPRFTAQWDALSGLRFFGSYGRGFRPPEARAFTSYEPAHTGLSEDLYQGGEPAMTYADAFELGARWAPFRYLQLQASGFATLIARESIYDHVSGVNLQLNRTRRVGVELDVASSPVDWLTLGADVTYTDARFVASGNPVPLAPPLVGGFRGVLTHPSGVQAGLRLLALGARPLPHGATGAPLANLDASVGYHRDRWAVDLQVENALALRIREGQYHFASYWNGPGSPSDLPVLQYVAGPPLNVRLNLAMRL